jgi:hypothetical protein
MNINTAQRGAKLYARQKKQWLKSRKTPNPARRKIRGPNG